MHRTIRHLLVLAVVATALIAILFAAAAPTIKSLSPVSGYHGSAVTITGTNFGATQGKSTVTFNGVPALIASWTDTVIKTGVPQAPLGAVKVVVTVDGMASNSAAFNIKLR